MSVEWKLFGKVVHHPAVVTLTVVVSFFLFIVAFVLSPVLVPIHFLLRRFGKNGFYFNKRVCIGKDSFAYYVPFDKPILGQGLRRL